MTLRRSIRRLGLASKFSLLVIGLAVASSCAIAWLILQQWHQGELQRLRYRGRLLASLLAETAQPFLRDSDGFQEFVDRFEPDLDVAYICLFDAQGRSVAHRALRGPIPHLEKDAGPALPVQEFTSDDGELESIEFRTPVLAYSEARHSPQTSPQLIGYLHLGMGLDRLKQRQSEFVRSIALGTLVVVILGSLASLLLVRRLTAPIKDLANAAERISKGDYNHSIAIGRGDQFGDLAGAFNRMLDHLRRYREEIETQKQTLEERVERRSAELMKAAQAASAAARQAEEANRAKSRILASMSHELRTPLNSVLGMSELLLSSSLNARQQRMVEMVRESGQALLQVIQNILDFSRIEAGSLALEESPTEMNALIDDALGAAAAAAGAKGIDLSSRIDPQIPKRLIGDPGRLAQVLKILLENAVKFSHEGRVEVRAGLLGREIEKQDLGQESITVLIEVEDQGIGIDKKMQGQIFRSFSQADGSTRRRFGGTGLGLAIAKQLIEKMGGEIGVESSPGNGARFWFSVPLKIQDSKSRPQQDERHEALSPRSLHASVLLAEDNAANQQLVLEMLKGLGCRVHLAMDGQEAVEAFSRKDFDLVLLDCQMPVLDGYEATCLIRSMEQSQSDGCSNVRRTPVIALTANAMEGDRQHCLATGMDDYIAKPFTSLQLYECLQRWIADPALTGQNAEEGKPGPEAPHDAGPAFDSTALDPQALQQIQQLEAQGAAGLLKRLIQLFMKDGPPLLARLDEATRVGNLQGLRDAAHSLKSMAANLGLARLAGTAKEIESLARRGAPMGKIKKLVAVLKVEYPVAERTLPQFLQESSSDSLAVGN